VTLPISAGTHETMEAAAVSSRPETDPAPTRAAEQPSDRPERVCPNCGRALLERKCKLLCPNLECGYYMSCSDFY
jgi:hypothetical protein